MVSKGFSPRKVYTKFRENCPPRVRAKSIVLFPPSSRNSWKGCESQGKIISFYSKSDNFWLKLILQTRLIEDTIIFPKKYAGIVKLEA